MLTFVLKLVLLWSDPYPVFFNVVGSSPVFKFWPDPGSGAGLNIEIENPSKIYLYLQFLLTKVIIHY